MQIDILAVAAYLQQPAEILQDAKIFFRQVARIAAAEGWVAVTASEPIKDQRLREGLARGSQRNIFEGAVSLADDHAQTGNLMVGGKGEIGEGKTDAFSSHSLLDDLQVSLRERRPDNEINVEGSSRWRLCFQRGEGETQRREGREIERVF